MPQKGQITQLIKNIADWIRPKFVYEVRYHYTLYSSMYFRTEREALKYIEDTEHSDPAIYNGAAYCELIKHSFYGERTDNKA